MIDGLKTNTGAIFHLEVDELAKAHMLETARWAKFLAIVFFILFGLVLVSMVAMIALVSNISNKYGASGADVAALNSGVSIISIIVALGLYFYPVYALYKFSSVLKTGINTANQEEFNRALGYQKSMFKYMGILTIIALVFYGIAIVFMGVGLIAAGI